MMSLDRFPVKLQINPAPQLSCSNSGKYNPCFLSIISQFKRLFWALFNTQDTRYQLNLKKVETLFRNSDLDYYLMRYK